ncbi:MAG: cell division protein FtsQ [Mycobacteriales bacterium]
MVPPRTPRRLLVLAVALTLLAGAAGWIVGFTGVFGVRTVTVTGLRTLPAGQITTAAGIRQGQPLARLDVAAVADRVGGIPGVARVAVTRSWPSTVRIAVTERRGVAAVTVAGRLWLVDGTGVRFQRLTAVPAGMPRLAVRDAGPDDPATAAALAAVAALTPQVRAAVRVVTARTPDSVTLALTGGRTVAWGGAAESPAKARVLAALLSRPGTMYDVSTPSVVTVR